MVRVVSRESKKMWQEHEQGSQRQRDWNEVDICTERRSAYENILPEVSVPSGVLVRPMK